MACNEMEDEKSTNASPIATNDENNRNSENHNNS